jgi:minor extracellular serine protease Vpr
MVRKAFAWGVVLALLVGLTSIPILAQNPELQPAPRPIDRLPRSPELRVPAAEIQIDLENLPYGARNAVTQAGAVPLMIELEAEPLAVRYAQSLGSQRAVMSGESQMAYVNELASQQQQLRPQIEAAGARIVSTYQKAYNGIQVRASLDQLGALANLPGVKAVHRIPLHMPSRGTSMPWIGVNALQDDLGLDGTGITIAIIDSGIDYYHADLGGSGIPQQYANDDPNQITPGSFPTAKVIGGYDFAGPTYDPSSSDPDIATPDPDPDPLDVFGHGSHVAGIAAGLGVTGTIAPGAAPGALLYAVKVFADVQAATTLTVDGIEWAMDPNQDGDIGDHADVMNLSLGAGFGSPDDPSAIALNNAATAGVVVAAAAGNAGDVMYIHDSPGNAERAIGVAASIDNDPDDNAETVVSISSPYTAEYEAIEGSDTEPLVNTGNVLDEIVHVGQGCVVSAGDTYLADPNGQIALIQRGNCSFEEKIQGVEAAGALAAIVYNNAGDELISMLATAGIPAVFIGQTDGEEIVAATTTDTVTGGLERNSKPELADTIADFSSRGPRGPDSLLKPDISAPGSRINSTAVGTGTEGTKFSGTSMSTPHIAGVAALLLELHPDWRPEEIKAALMNSAVDLSTLAGDNYPLSRQGAGRVDARIAADLEALALTDSGSLSFGVVPVDSNTTLIQQVTVKNKGIVAKTFDIDWHFQFPAEDEAMGVTLNLPAQVTVDPGSFADVPVEVQIDVGTLPPQTYDFNAWAVAEYDGFVTFTNQDRLTDTLRVPFHIIPRPTSHTQGPLSVDYVAPAAYSPFQLDNTGPITSSVYLLAGHGQDANEVEVADNADIRYSGLDIYGVQGTGTMSDTIVSFAVNTYGPWHTPQPYWSEFDVYIDNDEDGVGDYVVFNYNLGAARGGSNSDVFVPAVVNLSAGTITVPNWPPPYEGFLLTNYTEFNAATIEMPVKGIDIGLDASNTDFDFWIVGFDYNGNADLTAISHGDAAHPPLAFFWAAPAGEVPPASNNVAAVLPDFAGYHANARPDILAFYYNDVPGTGQAQYIPLTATWNTLYLPVIFRGY